MAAGAPSAAERNILDGYRAGINLGTWISQYNRKAPEFDTRVTAKDIDQIASWGMDHVRLPVDCDFFEVEGKPGEYREERLAYIDRTIEWAKKAGLNLILDLHGAPGYTFMNVGKNELFTNPRMQSRFLEIWSNFARRYRGEGESLLFELLNEVVEATPEQWNSLAAEAVEQIRAIDANRWVVIGGRNYNSINALKDIAILPDPRIVYNFHFYEHILFTHQNAGWNKISMDYKKFRSGVYRVDYPGELPDLAGFVAAYPQYKGQTAYVGRKLDGAWLREAVRPAVEFLKANDKPLYCGEYGVIRFAPEASKERWYEDFTGLLREHRIGRAAWCYKDGAFGFVDGQTGVVLNARVVKAASRR